MHTPKRCKHDVALEKRLNEIRRLEGINAKLLEALGLYHEIGRRKSDTCKNSAWKMSDQVAFEKAQAAIAEAKGE